MKIFAGNFSLIEKIDTPDIDFDIVQCSDDSYFIMGADDALNSSGEVIKFLSDNFGELKTHDISIEGEDELEIISSEYEEGTYESVSFQGPEVTFQDVLERFADSTDIVVVREAEESLLYENRVIKADFLY